MRLAVSSSHPLALLRVRSRREFGLVMKGGVLTSGIGFYPPSLSPLQQPTDWLTATPPLNTKS